MIARKLIFLLGITVAGTALIAWKVTAPPAGTVNGPAAAPANASEGKPSDKKADGEKVGIPVLCYHGTYSSKIAKNPYNVTPEKLAEQMKALYDDGYRTISLETFYRAMKGESVDLPAKPIVIKSSLTLTGLPARSSTATSASA